MAENLGLFDAAEVPLALRPPRAFRVLPRRLAIDYCCPRCGYEWATNPMPRAEDAERDLGSEPADGA